MNKNTLLIDSDYEEAEDFIKGVIDETKRTWDVKVFKNNTVYGIRRYIKFFIVGWNTFIHRRQYSAKTILCWQQFYGIVFACLCRLFHVKKQFRLVIMTFIYKPKSGLFSPLYDHFVRYAVTSSYVDAIVCTSKTEVNRYASKFHVSPDLFHFVKWGAVEYADADFYDPVMQKKNYYFSTGRSNRDYDFLIHAFRKSDRHLVIACDTLKRSGLSNIEIRDDIFGLEMLKYMKNAKAVIIALQDETIASGQLVLLHAMNMGVPVIITASQGVTDDYVIDGYNGLIIDKDEMCLNQAMEQLETDRELYQRISKNEKSDFHANYTKYVLGKNIGKVVNQIDNGTQIK